MMDRQPRFCPKCFVYEERHEYANHWWLGLLGLHEANPRIEYECPCCGSRRIFFGSGSTGWNPGDRCAHQAA